MKLSGIKQDIINARKQTNRNPSEAQIKAENYKKGYFKWNGLTIKIENPKGSTRSGTSPEGKKWSTTMKHDYGYIGKTKSKADGDAVDIFMGDHPDSQIVHIVDQINKDGKFDEHKCILGAIDEKEARKTYLANYEKGWKCGKITALTVEQFKEWIMKGKTGKPLKKQELFKVSMIKMPAILSKAMKSHVAKGIAVGTVGESLTNVAKRKTRVSDAETLKDVGIGAGIGAGYGVIRRYAPKILKRS